MVLLQLTSQLCRSKHFLTKTQQPEAFLLATMIGIVGFLIGPLSLGPIWAITLCVCMYVYIYIYISRWANRRSTKSTKTLLIRGALHEPIPVQVVFALQKIGASKKTFCLSENPGIVLPHLISHLHELIPVRVRFGDDLTVICRSAIFRRFWLFSCRCWCCVFFVLEVWFSLVRKVGHEEKC